MGYALTGGKGWNGGYRYIALIQIALTVILIFSLPLWEKRGNGADSASESIASEKEQKEVPVLSLKEIIRIPGAKAVMITFFCYCALESTTGLWASSYLVLYKGISTESAAKFASLFFLGITIGRALSGFLTMKLNDTKMIRLGQFIILMGIITMILPFDRASMFGLLLIGLGCAPVYPCIIHSTPHHFGADKSQAIIGVQMASAYVGTCLMPPLFGLVAKNINVALFPVFLSVILVLMVIMHEILVKRKTES